jgi:type IX secretion system PorP/SprF family membrane protein
MIRKRYIHWAIAVLSILTFPFVGKGQGQEVISYGQVISTVEFVNPAYNAHFRGVSASILHREQWTGIEGAPSTSAFSVYKSLPWYKLGVGITGFREKIGLRTVVNVSMDLNVNLRMSNQSYITFGIRGGVESSSLNGDEAEYIGENGVNFHDLNRLVPSIGFGTYYYGPRFFGGLSTLSLVYHKDEDFGFLPGFDFYIGYLLSIARVDTWYLKPAVLVKYYEDFGETIDLSLNALFKDKYWFGISYRHEDSYGVNIDFRVRGKVRMGYAYEIPIGPIIKYSGGSHEVRLSFRKVQKRSRRYIPLFYHFN